MNPAIFFPDAANIVLPKKFQLYSPEKSIRPYYAYFIKSGICCLKTNDAKGEEHILLFQKAPRFVTYFPLMREFPAFKAKDMNFSIASQYTITKCNALKIDASEFYEKMEQDDNFKNTLIHQIFDDYTELLSSYINKMEDSASIRFYKLLLEYSTPDKEKRKLESHLTNELIANYLGVHTVTVSRIMSKLTETGCLLKKGKDIYIAKAETLQKMIDDRIDLSY